MKLFGRIMNLTMLSALVKAEAAACIGENATYVVNFHAHVQSEIQDALISIASKLNGGNLNNEYVANDGENAAVAASRSYLGTVLEELNADLYKHKVQINLVLDPLEMDQLNIMGSADPSCELENALKSRTQLAYDGLVEKYTSFVGNHFFIFGCVISQDQYEAIEVIEKGNCGRVAGIMWKNSNNTKDLIKSAIMQSLTGTADLYKNGQMVGFDRNALCSYAEKCISGTPSTSGQLLKYLTQITYTKDIEEQPVRRSG